MLWESMIVVRIGQSIAVTASTHWFTWPHLGITVVFNLWLKTSGTLIVLSCGKIKETQGPKKLPKLITKRQSWFKHFFLIWGNGRFQNGTGQLPGTPPGDLEQRCHTWARCTEHANVFHGCTNLHTANARPTVPKPDHDETSNHTTTMILQFTTTIH